jgi:hypothetical protein
MSLLGRGVRRTRTAQVVTTAVAIMAFQVLAIIGAGMASR